MQLRITKYSKKLKHDFWYLTAAENTYQCNMLVQNK